ncbi:MAG: hypothetical protein QM775_35490 [Pirellulales bacterium]
MYRRHGDKLALVFLACDLGVTTVAWFASYAVRFGFFAAPEGVPRLTSVAAALPLVLLSAAAAYRLCGLYEIHRMRKLPRETADICKAGLLLLLLASSAMFYQRDLYESRLAFALFLVINIAALSIGRRFVWRTVKHLRGQGMNHSRAVIVGCGRTGRLVAETIARNRWTGLEAVGFVDSAPKREPTVLPRLGTIDQLTEVVRRADADHVFVALPLTRYGELPSVYKQLEDLLVEVQLVPDRPNLAGMHVATTEVDNLAFIGLRSNPQLGWAAVVKRATDLVVGGAALARAFAADARARGGREAHEPRARVLSPRTNGPRRPTVLDVEVPQHAQRRRTCDRRRVGQSRRRSLHAVGALHAAVELGRVTAVVECIDGRDELGRPATGTRRVRRAVPSATAELLATATREVRHDRLGSSARLARQHEHPQTAGV